jgi:hypothetical protein
MVNVIGGWLALVIAALIPVILVGTLRGWF